MLRVEDVDWKLLFLVLNGLIENAWSVVEQGLTSSAWQWNSLYIYIYSFTNAIVVTCVNIYLYMLLINMYVAIYQICIYPYPNIIWRLFHRYMARTKDMKKSPLCITISVYLKGAPNAFSTFFNDSILHHLATCLCHGKCPSSGHTSVSSAPELWLQEDSCICLHSMPHCLCNNFGKMLKF